MNFYKEEGFKETPIGWIPEDWKVVKLGDLCRFQRGFSYHSDQITKEPTKFRFITINDFEKEGGLKRDAERIYIKENVSIDPDFFLNNGDILIANTDMSRGFIIGAPILIEDVNGKLVYSMDLTRLIFDKSIIDSKFLFYYLTYKPIRQKMKSFSQGTNVLHLNHKLVKNMKITLPLLLEQKAIAHVLSTVDKAIQKTDEIIMKTKRLKRGLMQELLMKGIGHKEFKDTELGRIPKEWKVVRLGDTLDLCQYGLSIKMDRQGKYPIIRMDEIEDGYVVPRITKYVNLDEKTFRMFKLEKGDILFNRTNSYELVGRTGIFLLDGNYVFASYLIRLRVKRDIADPHFLTFYMIFSHNRLRQLATRAVHQANINATNLRKFKVPLPPLEEQKRIAEILSSIDNILKLKKKKREKLVRMKRRLMDLLLTGKVRVRL
ncbi:MAG: restriction endonuclease subunit S [archaeon GB-1867-035]|nr:restriction endonuclease subunit S [Candidatus Culexmicrobium profundum]